MILFIKTLLKALPLPKSWYWKVPGASEFELSTMSDKTLLDVSNAIFNEGTDIPVKYLQKRLIPKESLKHSNKLDKSLRYMTFTKDIAPPDEKTDVKPHNSSKDFQIFEKPIKRSNFTWQTSKEYPGHKYVFNENCMYNFKSWYVSNDSIVQRPFLGIASKLFIMYDQKMEQTSNR